MRYLIIEASGGSTPAYIVLWDEPQPLDHTYMEQGSRCIKEVSWRPSHEAELISKGARSAGLACGDGRPHFSTSVLPFRSCVFWCPLEPSHQFLCNSDVIWFGSLAPTLLEIILFLSLKIQ